MSLNTITTLPGYGLKEKAKENRARNFKKEKLDLEISAKQFVDLMHDRNFVGAVEFFNSLSFKEQRLIQEFKQYNYVMNDLSFGKFRKDLNDLVDN